MLDAAIGRDNATRPIHPNWMETLIMRASETIAGKELDLGFRAVLHCGRLRAWSASRSPTMRTAIGRKIENFTLEDYRGRKRSLADWADSKLVVVAFLGTECPLANLYVPRLTELAADFESKGVAFVGINANQQDSITEVAAHAQRHKIPFPDPERSRQQGGRRSLAPCARPRCSCSMRTAWCATGAASTISTASAIRRRKPTATTGAGGRRTAGRQGGEPAEQPRPSAA